ncbi:SIR2 family protein, partial [Sphingopyxis terrae]|uniref:SIR2 family protein n=1 Tax=Sphingopyxis terrae TaxID=33052 RepID=UPI000A8D21D1
MIDPLISLAFSLQSNKGAYALLIGSGVSRPAGIPTGWEITLEMVRKVAISSSAETGDAADQWYRETYQKEPDYSELLDQLCKSNTERQQYLKPFFEPADEEREEGLKKPTAAHNAIAELMAEGYIRVIITTNFDRLLEQALEARGIVPVVIANADQARGMLPLVHQKHCIIKIHGDYLDTRIMNTENELSHYPPEMDQLLDRVFDEFGIIFCGWSGAWDPALRSALSRAPSRRFSSYWMSRGDLNDDAAKIVSDRGIVPVKIADADTFFSGLSEKLASLR